MESYNEPENVGFFWSGELDTRNTGGIIKIERLENFDTTEVHDIVIVTGKLLPSIEHGNFQNKSYFFTRGQAGLDKNWELCHLWAPRFGDESRVGIMHAPKILNQQYQNKCVESWLDQFRTKDGSVLLRTTAKQWCNNYLQSMKIDGIGKNLSKKQKEKGTFLKQVAYEIVDCPPGTKNPQNNASLLGTKITIDIGPPIRGLVPKLEITEGKEALGDFIKNIAKK